MGGYSSHKNAIDSVINQIRATFPDKIKLVRMIRQCMMKAKEYWQIADYYYGGSKQYDDVIVILPKYFPQLLRRRIRFVKI